MQGSRRLARDYEGEDKPEDASSEVVILLEMIGYGDQATMATSCKRVQCGRCLMEDEGQRQSLDNECGPPQSYSATTTKQAPSSQARKPKTDVPLIKHSVPKDG